MNIIESGYKKYELNYWLKKDALGYSHSSGFGFPCDKDGNVKENEMQECAKKNLRYCRENPQDFDGPYIESQTYIDRQGKCDICGKMFSVFGDRYGEYKCPNCGQLYNVFGQMLVASAWDAPEYGDI